LNISQNHIKGKVPKTVSSRPYARGSDPKRRGLKGVLLIARRQDENLFERYLRGLKYK
jgi:hypothetical protein